MAVDNGMIIWERRVKFDDPLGTYARGSKKQSEEKTYMTTEKFDGRQGLRRQ